MYNLFQRIISKHGSTTKYFIDNYVLPLSPKSIFEIGCGTGSSLQYLPENINYTGIDISSNYIDFAKNKYGNRGDFILEIFWISNQ